MFACVVYVLGKTKDAILCDQTGGERWRGAWYGEVGGGGEAGVRVAWSKRRATGPLLGGRRKEV